MKSKDIVKVENLKITDDTYTIRWNMTRLCNYYCDFCIQGNKKTHLIDSKGESKKLRQDICNDIIDFIENKINKKYSRLRIDLIGGEITILSDFYELLEKLVNCKYEGNMVIKIKTNLSLSYKLIKKLKKLFKNRNDRKLVVSASYYKEYTSDKEFIKKIKMLHMNKNYIPSYTNSIKKNIKKIIQDFLILIKLMNQQSNISIFIVYPLINDNDYNDYLAFKKKYKKYTNGMTFLVIRNYKNTISDNLKSKIVGEELNKDIKVRLKNGQILYFPNTSKISYKLDNKHFDPYGYVCDAGIQSICIDNLGNVSRCPNYNGKSTTLDKMDLVNDKIKCPYHECHCGYYRTIER